MNAVATSHAPVPPLSVWSVEVLRVTRTRRLLGLVVLSAFLGAAGPLVAAYAAEIFQHLSGSSNVTVRVAAAVPADGVLGYHRSALQLGLVAAIVVAALAFSVDARPGLSTFYRTRAPMGVLLLPRLVVSAGAAATAYTAGLLLAWYETVVLIGPPALTAVVVTWAAGVGYTTFAVCLTLLCSAVMRTPLGAVGASVVVVLLLPLLGQLPGVSPYLPTALNDLPRDVFLHTGAPTPVRALAVTAAVALLGSPLAALAIGRRR